MAGHDLGRDRNDRDGGGGGRGPIGARQQAAQVVKIPEEGRAAIEARETADYYTNAGQHEKAAPYLDKFQRSRPVELWAAVDYYIRKGQADKAVPYLDLLTKHRLDPATVLALRDQFGRESFERLYLNVATRPYARPLNDALAAAAAPLAGQAPGPELFAREPRTPIELWDAADYLIRTGQAAEGGAVPGQVPEGPARRRDAGRGPGPVRGRLVHAAGRRPGDPAVRSPPDRRPGGGGAAVRDPSRSDRAVHRRSDPDPRRAGICPPPPVGGGPLRGAAADRGPAAAGAVARGSRPPGPEHRPAAALGRPAAGRRAGVPRSRSPAADAATALGLDRRRLGRAVPDVPGGLAGREPGGAIGRPGGDRAIDRPAVRPAAEAAGPHADRCGLVVSPRPSRGSRRAGRPLVVGRGPQGPGPARGDARRGPHHARPAIRAAGPAAGPERSIGPGRAAQPGPGAGRRAGRSRGRGGPGAGHLRRGDRRRAGTA